MEPPPSGEAMGPEKVTATPPPPIQRATFALTVAAGAEAPGLPPHSEKSCAVASAPSRSESHRPSMPTARRLGPKPRQPANSGPRLASWTPTPDASEIAPAAKHVPNTAMTTTSSMSVWPRFDRMRRHRFIRESLKERAPAGPPTLVLGCRRAPPSGSC